MNHAGMTTTALEPSDLAFLQRFYKDMCAERGVPGDTSAATELAAHIIELYQQGVRSEQDLQSKLTAVFHNN
ncbi:hypothetical protein EPK99_12105 [Neorhizobium lilium]|uniref:Uncharacterized protein n=1 Tax=Neorhizobium lilium TaxID=2503024 RepID=A0A444LJW5_9HYPH|nr:hypothetical protein [Neorhizobium lilium]RWX79289.1 hypothetical protein EPK99_12105 [Neorhizobium lilium]